VHEEAFVSAVGCVVRFVSGFWHIAEPLKGLARVVSRPAGREEDNVKQPTWRWPGDKKIALIFNVCLEAWSDGKAPGISPMGNPLPAGALDTMAISWAAYGVKRGIHRLLDVLKRHGVKASVMTNAIIAERSPEAVKAVADAGHEVLSHSYSMDVIPALLSADEQKKNIMRCTALLERASGKRVVGWLSPRGTSGPELPKLLAEAGYSWYGDVFDDDLPYVQEFGRQRIVAIPLSTDVNDMPFMKYGNAPKTMLNSFEETLEAARANNGVPAVIDVTVHAHIFGRPRGAHVFDHIAARAASLPDVWIATRAEIADFILARNA
jgi:peptidoglycan/xylan/chitin deacetylase (PgdA/CDA1 family)